MSVTSTSNPRLTRSSEIPLQLYIDVQRREVDSPLNHYGAWQEFGHEPTSNECWEHYIHCGRSEEMSEIHSDNNIALACQQNKITTGAFKKLLTSNPEGAEQLLHEAFALVMWLTGVRLDHDPRTLSLEQREQELVTTYQHLLAEEPI